MRIVLTISVLLVVSSARAQFTLDITYQPSSVSYGAGSSYSSMSSPSLYANGDHMTTGSRYATGVQEVGAVAPVPMYRDTYSSPAGAPAGMRRTPPDEDDDDYDPDNAQFGDLADGTFFLLLLAALATFVVTLRRKHHTQAA